MKPIVLFAAGVLFLFTGAIQAAHLTAESGGLWGQVDRYISDSDANIPWDPTADGGPTYCHAATNVYTESSWASAELIGEVLNGRHWDGDISVMLSSNSEGESVAGIADVQAYATGGTLVPAQTDGIFFRIEPDEGETAGTRVRIRWHWYAGADTIDGNVEATVGSNGIFLTRNIEPPTGMPTTGIVWSREGIAFTTNESFEEEGWFVAEIGEVIGVFTNINTSIQVNESGYSHAAAITAMDLWVGAAVSDLIEYPYAPGLVYDPVQNITFLKDLIAAGEPMSWYEAVAWAEDFQFVSNGTTYSNWRLPTTTDEQGACIGELGFLHTNCAISEEYFGPFAHISDGDYWTSPQFSRDPDPAIAYVFTFSTTYGPAQWDHPLDYDECYAVPVFDGPPRERWCPADFDNNGVVDFVDFAVFSSYWLMEREEPIIR